MTLKLAADGTWVNDPSGDMGLSWADDSFAMAEISASETSTAAAAPLSGASTAAPPATVTVPTLPSAETAEIAYVTGINSNGTLASRSYWTDEGTYAHKWGTPIAGTASGTITYSFSGFTAAQQATLTGCLALWSSVANVSFQLVATGGALTLRQGTDGQADTNDTYNRAGNSGLGRVSSAVVSIDPTTNGFELDGSFTTNRGYGLGTAIHEIGHALGFGHAGDYNGSANSGTDQYSAYDTRLWSLMSYIQPSDTSAEYYSQYTVTGTNWQGAQNPTTMMMLDILGMQELYGTPSGATTYGGNLSGGQVFGFNTNVDSSIRNFFDFTVNTTPVITIWDGGTGNTLDVSGYSTDDTINLNAGTFSSVNTLVNDIGIAYNTRIDTAVGGSGNVTFFVNADADTIRGGSGTNTVVFSGNRAAYTLARTGANTVTATANGVTDTLINVATLRFADATVQSSTVTCFTRGTRIAVPGGEVAVEALAAGDLVLTASGTARRVRWVGTRAYAGRFLARNPGVQPVRIRRGALGGGLPRRDLLVSPSHALLLDGVLVQAGHLVDGRGVVRERGWTEVAYFHVELDTHDVLLAEGAAAESYLDDDNRGLFQNAGTFTGPEAAEPARYCAPRVSSGPALDVIRRRLSVARTA